MSVFLLYFEMRWSLTSTTLRCRRSKSTGKYLNIYYKNDFLNRSATSIKSNSLLISSSSSGLSLFFQMPSQSILLLASGTCYSSTALAFCIQLGSQFVNYSNIDIWARISSSRWKSSKIHKIWSCKRSYSRNCRSIMSRVINSQNWEKRLTRI